MRTKCWTLLMLLALVAGGVLHAATVQVLWRYTEKPVTSPGGSITVSATFLEDQQYEGYVNANPSPQTGFMQPLVRILDGSGNVVAQAYFSLPNPPLNIAFYDWTNTYTATVNGVPAGNYTLSIRSGYRGGLVSGDGYFLNHNVADPLKTEVYPWVQLDKTSSTPQAGISASASSISAGGSVDLALTRPGTGNASSGHVLSGPNAFSVTDPSSPRSVSPPNAGSNIYTYTVKGYVTLKWTSMDSDGIFELTLPNGSKATVTNLASYPVTQTGDYTIKQTTTSGKEATHTINVAVSDFATATASTTITVNPLTINNFSGSVTTPTPAASITASPSSGTAPLSSLISWTTSNASSFSVTKNAAAWASSGLNKNDPSLGGGSYTYVITAQPQAYAASLSWSVTGGVSYRVTGPSSYDSGWITGTSLSGLAASGTYTLTAADGANGAGNTKTSQFTLGAGPAVVMASTTVNVGKASQTVTISPALLEVAGGAEAVFQAFGGQTSYVWSGQASGAGASKRFAAPVTPGDYAVGVMASGDGSYEASAVAQAVLRVRQPAQVELSPLASEYVVRTAGDPLEGRVFKRLWKEGSRWKAYLGRSGLRFSVSGNSPLAVSQVELQARDSGRGASWQRLAGGAPMSSERTSTGFRAGAEYAVKLGETARGSALVPLSYEQGAPLVGEWRFRARVQDVGGQWSDWSAELPVDVVLPVTAKSEELQTLPPAGEEGAWFVASEPRRFDFLVWIP